ncbi:MAG: hypothetical protein R3Y64_09680 [Peptostreptococcaceae bacterium]
MILLRQDLDDDLDDDLDHFKWEIEYGYNDTNDHEHEEMDEYWIELYKHILE